MLLVGLGWAWQGAIVHSSVTCTPLPTNTYMTTQNLPVIVLLAPARHAGVYQGTQEL